MITPRRTILISSLHPLISRNILQTKLLDSLSVDADLVIVVPKTKEQYFVESFAREGVVICGIKEQLSANDLFFRGLFLALSKTKGVMVKERTRLGREKNFIFFGLTWVVRLLFGGSKLWTMAWRRLDALLTRDPVLAGVFEQFKPNLVFITDVQNAMEVKMLREAIRRRIPTVGMVRSWDNLVSKGILRSVPDLFLVQNDIIKREAIELSFVPDERIKTVGIAHYDKYLKPKCASDRDSFFLRLKLDLNKKLLVFAPVGSRYVEWNIDLEALTALSELDLNILVRLPPGDDFPHSNFVSRRARVVFDDTGHDFGGGDKKNREISPADEGHLIDTLNNCDVVVTGHSTFLIDACVFDKPVVLLYFKEPSNNYYEGVRKYFDLEYFKPVWESGAACFAHSSDELRQLVSIYLDQPAKDNQGRRRLVTGQLKYLDGQSTERLVKAIRSAFIRNRQTKSY